MSSDVNLFKLFIKINEINSKETNEKQFTHRFFFFNCFIVVKSHNIKHTILTRFNCTVQ